MNIARSIAVHIILNFLQIVLDQSEEQQMYNCAPSMHAGGALQSLTQTQRSSSSIKHCSWLH